MIACSQTRFLRCIDDTAIVHIENSVFNDLSRRILEATKIFRILLCLVILQLICHFNRFDTLRIVAIRFRIMVLHDIYINYFIFFILKIKFFILKIKF